MIDFTSHDYLQNILQFLDKIGVTYKLQAISQSQFLPGIYIENGTLLIDRAQLNYPGDVIHEAGHLAVTEPETRKNLQSPIDEQLDFDAATHEMMTLAWSYAAAIASNTPLEVVFHPDGYKGQNQSIIDGFNQGQYIGLPMLQWLGMAYDSTNALINNQPAYPEMITWLRPAKELVA